MAGEADQGGDVECVVCALTEVIRAGMAAQPGIACI